MRVILSALLVVLVLMPTAALAQVPRTVIAEDATATWCQYCPDAYAGLEVMKSRYDANEFNAVRYYATSGGLGSAKTDARIAYYNVTGFPTVVFDGTAPVVGGGATVATGDAYEPLVSRDIASPSPIAIHINSASFAGPTGSINVDLTVVQAIPDISNMKVRIVVLENNVRWSAETEQDVTRDIPVDTPLTVSQVGQTQNITQSFAINGAWKPVDLWACVFVQNDTNKSILQSANTRPAPAYSVRFWAEGARAAIAPWNGAYSFQDFAVYNMGTSADVITVALNAVHVPAGWSAVFTDGANDFTSTDLSLNPGESRTFHVRITPNSPGYADARIVLTSSHLPGRTRAIEYNLVTTGLPVLLVKDDGGTTFENYYFDALTNYGVSYGLWNTNSADVTAELLSHFPVVIWETGLSYPTLTASDRAALGNYLDHGGKLFINGQDIGWEMNDTGGSALTWYHTYLHADFITDDTGVLTLTGVTGDPITNGMSIAISGGDGANNEAYPDAISPRDAAASTIFNYTSGGYKGGIKVQTATYQVVYLGFGYEAISTAANRRLLVARILSWFGMRPADAPDADAIAPGASVSAFPNPAHAGSTLRLSLPSAGPARLGIYALDGSLVRTLVNGVRPAGQQTLVWDGRDDAGRALPSGVYFYRLNVAGQDSPSGKLILTR